MSGFERISRNELDYAFASVRRQYLAGEPKLPQIVNAIKDSRVEIGISRYTTASSEAPHCHAVATEYQYLLSGMTEYYDIDAEAYYIFKSGDFYSISPGTKYAQRVKQGTAILFVKVPGGNDKQLIEVDRQTRSWLETPLRVRRTDHMDNPVLRPNSLRPAVSIAASDSQRRILILRRRDSDKWTMPGGTFELGEDISGCAKREFHEETGLDVAIDKIIGTYSNPRHLIEYSDGEVRQEFTILLSGVVYNTSVSIDDESTEFNWVTPREALNREMAPSQRRRVEDVIQFFEKGAVAIR